MIKYFSLKNWGPFKELNEWHGDLLNPKNADYYDNNITSMAMIYGRNMSGKSVFIEALKFIKRLISGDGKVDYWHTDYYYNGPKEGVQCKAEPTEFVLEFASHDKLYRYEISMLLQDRSIVSENLLYKDLDTPKKRFKFIYSRENYTDIKLYFDFGEFGHLLEKYFNDTDETLIHRMIITNGALDVDEIAIPYHYFKNDLHFVDEESFIATETGVSLTDILVPNIMDKLDDMGVPVDGYDLIERTDRSFIELYGNDAAEIKRIMGCFEGDSINIILCNKHGIFIITNTTESVYKCYRLALSRNGIDVNSKGLINIAKLAIMSICTDDGTYIYDDFISSVDERYIQKFFDLWKGTVRYKQFIGISSNTNFMDWFDRADVSFITHDAKVSKVINPMKDLKWRNDKLLSKGYLEEIL